IEGIKPIEPLTEEDSLTYAVEDGLFKRLCTEASFSYTRAIIPTDQTESALDFSSVYDLFVDSLNERFSKNEQVKLETRSGGHVTVEKITEKDNIVLRHEKGNRTYIVSKKRLSKLAQAFPDLSALTNINDQFRAEIGGA